MALYISLAIFTIFDALREWFEGPDFRGCAFINASVELANADHPGHRVALEHQLIDLPLHQEPSSSRRSFITRTVS